MLSFIRSTAAAALAAVTLAGAAPAAIVNYDFTATIVDPASGPYSGLTGTGTFSYDDSQIPTSGSSAGNINLFANFFGFPQFDFTLNILGQTFTDVEDPFANLNIRNYEPISFAFDVGAGVIDDPFIRRLRTVPVNTSGFNLTDLGDNQLAVDMIVEVVPLPASIWMLGAGVLGLGAWARRRSKPA